MRPQRMGFIMGLVAAVASGLQVPEANKGEVCGKVCRRGDLEGAQVQQPGLNKADPAHCSRRQVQRHPAY